MAGRSKSPAVRKVWPETKLTSWRPEDLSPRHRRMIEELAKPEMADTTIKFHCERCQVNHLLGSERGRQHRRYGGQAVIQQAIDAATARAEALRARRPYLPPEGRDRVARPPATETLREPTAEGPSDTALPTPVVARITRLRPPR